MSKWEIWKNSWLHRETLEEPRKTWANIAFAMNLSCQKLLYLDCFANSYKTAFGSSIDEILSLSSGMWAMA
jgi:alkylhydroperoxidase/carboxymuconolactone decarboxylase family protein YurZ